MIKNLEPDMKIEGEKFLVSSLKHQNFKNKKGYFVLLKLQDKTGTIDAVLWESEKGVEISEGDVVAVDGTVGEYEGTMQIKIDVISQIHDFPMNYQPWALTWEDDKKKLDCFVNRNKRFYSFLKTIFGDEKIYNNFITYPAARGFHHAYLGGLLQHTVNVAEIAQSIGRNYNLDNDLIIAGSLLHDIGKIREYSVDGPINKTVEGELLGHMHHGIAIVQEKIDINNRNREKLNMLFHIILSHHGHNEWGSPVLPQFSEAMVVHYADLADSKLKMFKDAEEEKGEDNTHTYSPKLGRKIYRYRRDSQ